MYRKIMHFAACNDGDVLCVFLLIFAMYFYLRAISQDGDLVGAFSRQFSESLPELAHTPARQLFEITEVQQQVPGAHSRLISRREFFDSFYLETPVGLFQLHSEVGTFERRVKAALIGAQPRDGDG